eukprot:1741804-Alexandrium_andersonii.AAC.1
MGCKQGDWLWQRQTHSVLAEAEVREGNGCLVAPRVAGCVLEESNWVHEMGQEHAAGRWRDA